MITATSTKQEHVTELTNGKHVIYADTPVEDGGSDLYQRPGELLASAYAACVNITTRKELNKRGLAYEQVVVQVEMDRSNPEKLTFRTRTEIHGDLPEEVKAEIIELVKDCPVCSLLRAEKEFLPL